MKTLTPDAFLGLLASTILGADHSLEVIAPVGSLPFAVEEFLAVADDRLRLRCLLSLPGPHLPSTDHSLTKLVTHPAWESRFADAIDDFLIILDTTAAFAFSLGHYWMTEGPVEAKKLDEEFHVKWDGAHELNRIYSDRSSTGVLVATFSPTFWSWLIKELSANPAALHELNPRRFEELVAELLGVTDSMPD